MASLLTASRASSQARLGSTSTTSAVCSPELGGAPHQHPPCHGAGTRVGQDHPGPPAAGTLCGAAHGHPVLLPPVGSPVLRVPQHPWVLCALCARATHGCPQCLSVFLPPMGAPLLPGTHAPLCPPCALGTNGCHPFCAPSTHGCSLPFPHPCHPWVPTAPCPHSPRALLLEALGGGAGGPGRQHEEEDADLWGGGR